MLYLKCATSPSSATSNLRATCGQFEGFVRPFCCSISSLHSDNLSVFW